MRPPTSPARARRPSTARDRSRGVVVRWSAAAALVAAALASPSASAAAQSDTSQPAQLVRVQRAFEPSVTLSLGTTKFGSRTYDVNGTYGYSPAISLAATLDLPLTRRTAVMLDASVVPASKQEASSDAGLGSYTARSAAVTTADVGLAGRLKANVPVFFLAGVGVLHASRVASPFGVDAGAATEPRATVAVGYDVGLASASRIGLRALVAAHFTKPTESGVAGETTKSITTDYTFRLGARWRLSGSPAR